MTKTVYNGSKSCGCGKLLPPQIAMYDDECWSCKQDRYTKLLKNRMAP